MDDGFANFELEERKVVAALLKNSDAFIDVGAHHGFYSVLATSLGVSAIALEPDEANLALLKVNAAGRPIEVIGKAVSDKPGRMTFFGDGEAGSLIESWEGFSKSYQRKVEVVTLDAILMERFEGKCLFIKVDVEGNEDKVIDGATAVLKRPNTTWMIETLSVSPSGVSCQAYLHLFKIMAENGYSAHYAVGGEVAEVGEVGRATDPSMRNIIFSRASI